MTTSGRAVARPLSSNEGPLLLGVHELADVDVGPSS